MIWQNPIFDRTEDDVFKAREYIQKYILNKESGAFIEQKGCLNATDMNRINNNLLYIKDYLSNYGYEIEFSTTPKIDYNTSDILYNQDFIKIIENINIIKNAFINPSGCEVLPTIFNSYKSINAIEQNIFKIKESIDNLNNNYISGISHSGVRNSIPIKYN